MIERQGGLWHWEMTAKGEHHVGKRGEPTAAMAAEQAVRMQRALDFARHFQRERAGAGH